MNTSRRSGAAAAAICMLAFAAFAQEPNGPTIGQLTKQLRHRSDAERLTAIDAIARLGPAAKRTASPLAKLLTDASDGIADAAAVALGRIGIAAKKQIKNALSDRKTQWRGVAAVAEMGADAVPLLPEVTKLWRQDSNEGPAAITKCMKRLGLLAVPHLVKCLSDGHDANYAARTLGDLGPIAKDAVPELIKLSDTIDFSATAAITALGRIGDARATAPLIAMLPGVTKTDTTTSYKATSAVRALGAIGPDAKDAVQPLLELLDIEAPSSYYRGSIASAIAAIGDTEPATMRRLDQLRAAGGDSADEAQAALDTLRPGPHAAAAVLLRNVTSHKSPALRILAARELGARSVDDKAVKALAAAVEDADAEVARTAIAALGGFGNAAKDAIPALEKAISSDDATIAKAAAAALAAIQKSGGE